MFTGKNTDFGKDWYPDVGYQLLVYMLFYVYTPLMTLGTEWTTLKLKRKWMLKYVYPGGETSKYD